MESAKLEVKDRSEMGSAASRRMRRSGVVPVNLYGLERAPRAMVANQHDLERLVEKGYHIVELQQEDKTQVVLIHEVQWDAIGSSILHCDFMRIDRDKPVHVYVPIRFIGMAPEVAGSNVEKVLEDIHVETLPLQIPDEFVINLSRLEVGHTVTCGDLDMPAGCSLYGHQATDVVVVNHVKHGGSEAVVEDETLEPEVITKGKGDAVKS